MNELILQYALLGMVLICLIYLIYLVRDKGDNLNEDYFGLSYSIFSTLTSDERTKENVEKILKIIVSSIEELKELNLSIKELENEEVNLAREKISENGFLSIIDENSIRYVIRLIKAMKD